MEIAFGLRDILQISPLIVLFLFSLMPILIKVSRGNKEQMPIATLTMGVSGIVIALVLLVVFSVSGVPTFFNALVFDGLSKWVGVVILLASLGALMVAYENPATSGKQFSEFTFLLLNSCVGMLVMVAALDLLVLFIGLEMMSLPLYLLIAMSHEEKLAKESAFKYFVLGSFASAIFLYGVAFIFGSAGSTYLFDVAGSVSSLMTTSRIFVLGLTLVFLGFCFKVSIAPFHAWTPDVYQGAPTPILSFMATAVKAASFAAFLRVAMLKGMMSSENLLDIMQWLAVITMIVGNVAAILQDNLKRMLAYSSIAHSGYLLVGLITAGISGDSAFGSTSLVFYLLGYSIMTFGAIAIVALFEKNENTVLHVDDMAGFAKQRPFMAFAFTVFLLSLAGIPPTIGFFGKFYIFTAAVGEGLLFLALWGMLNSVVSAYYYLRPIVVMYMKDSNLSSQNKQLNATKLAIIFSVILVLTLGVFSDFLFKAVEASL